MSQQPTQFMTFTPYGSLWRSLMAAFNQMFAAYPWIGSHRWLPFTSRGPVDRPKTLWYSNNQI